MKKDLYILVFMVVWLCLSGLAVASGVNIKSANQNTDEKKSKFLQISINGGFGYVNDLNVTDLSFEEDFLEWKVSDRMSYGTQVEFIYMLNKHIGLSTGLGYNFLKTTYSISSKGINKNNNELIDVGVTNAFFDTAKYYLLNIEPYRKILNIPSYDSTIILKSFIIPLYMNLSFGNTVKLNIKTGFDISFIQSSEYKTICDSISYVILLYGLGVGNDPILISSQDPNSEDFGVYSVSPYKKNSKIETYKKVLVYTVLNLSLEVPLNEKLSLTPGINYKFSLTDLDENEDDYVDLFGQTEKNMVNIPGHIHKNKPVKSSMLVFQVGLKYKF